MDSDKEPMCQTLPPIAVVTGRASSLVWNIRSLQEFNKFFLPNSMGRFNRKKYLLLFSVLILTTVFFVIQITVQLERGSSALNTSELKILPNLSALSGEFEGFISNRMVLDSKKSDFYFFEKHISDGIGAFRELPDTRDEVCKEQVFNVPKKSKVSVIIVFRNEARSTLLRTIVSVLLRTPIKFLEEIIVIDDFSDDETVFIDLVKLPLGAFIKPHRNRQHNGLIESRNLGAKVAIGDYIVFLDSHSEVNVGWIEPLLDRLASYPGMAVSPVLDSTDATTFQYRASSKNLKGGFDWNLHFRWIPMDEEERESKKDPSDPLPSPVFAGGVFMISRNWFFKLNGFNPHLKVWGGESIEMSIKLWLCGGQIEIVPCSRVGHVFRKTEQSLDMPNGQHLRNRKIIADSWLDEYRYFFSTMKRKSVAGKNVEKLTSSAAGHTSIHLLAQVQRMKKDLQCRPFSWFLQTVFHELKLPPNEDYIAFGKLSSGKKCLKIVPATSGITTDVVVVLSDCYHDEASYWSFNGKDGRLVSDRGFCLSVGIKNSDDSRWQMTQRVVAPLSVTLDDCNKSKRWMRMGGKLIHENSQLCLDNPLSEVVTMSRCRRGVPSQLFKFSVELQSQ